MQNNKAKSHQGLPGKQYTTFTRRPLQLIAIFKTMHAQYSMKIDRINHDV